MKIQFCLAWQKGGKISAKSFKNPESFGLFSEYTNRISQFSDIETNTFDIERFQKKPGVKVWFCDFNTGSRMVSSEELAKRIDSELQSGAKELKIVIGGPDGLEEAKQIIPDFRWSFGPMTLPHELAAVVAAEQIYRAFTIIRKLPYHLGH